MTSPTSSMKPFRYAALLIELALPAEAIFLTLIPRGRFRTIDGSTERTIQVKGMVTAYRHKATEGL